MPRVESKIQDEIIRYLRGRGAYVYNTPGSASSAKGTSDLLVCYRGRFVGIEVKRPDGSYGETKPQEIRRRQIENAGGFTGVVKSVEDAKVIFDTLDWSIA